MSVKKSLSVSAENTWSEKFDLTGSSHNRGLPAVALICATSDTSTVTLRRYASDGTTVIASLDLDSTMAAIEVPVAGTYDVGVATGNYGAGAVTITVEQ